MRALHPETQTRILVSDTVGFIRNLPHDLVASFRSTLDEALDASLLLHVVDAADPALRSHIQVTKEVLEGIGAGELPSLLILNKIDAVDISQKALLKKEFPDAIAMSALDPKGIEALHSRLVSFFVENMAQVEFVVPYGKEGVLADIRKKHPRAQRVVRGKGCLFQDKGEPGHRYRLEATARFVRTPLMARVCTGASGCSSSAQDRARDHIRESATRQNGVRGHDVDTPYAMIRSS